MKMIAVNNQKTIDQSKHVLPPAWKQRAHDAGSSPAEVFKTFRTEPNRIAANEIIRSLRKACHTIVISTFLFADREIQKELLNAGTRGVRVYLLVASEARLEKATKDSGNADDFESRLRKQHEEMLNELVGWALIRTSSNFHAKVVLVDPLQQAEGYLLTANITERALGRNEELVIALRESECKAMFDCLRWAMWELSEHEVLARGRLSAVNALGRISRPAASHRVVATLNEAGSLRDETLRLINSASTQILVASFGWAVENEIVQALCNRARQGVKVTVLARIRAAAMPALQNLVEAGAAVVGFQYLHAKAIFTDQNEALVMSANFEAEGIERGFELGISLRDERAIGVRDHLQAWVRSAQHQLVLAPQLGSLLGPTQVWLAARKQLVAYNVRPDLCRTLPDVIAESAESLDVSPPDPLNDDGLPHPAHCLIATFNVVAPKLAPRSKELPMSEMTLARETYGGLRLFREPSGRVVVTVQTLDQLPRAIELLVATNASAIVEGS